METPNQQLDLDLKTEELGRLKKEISGLSEYKEKFHSSEQKVELQMKKNQRMQDKLFQLQTEINSSIGDNFAKQTLLGSNETTYESIIDNLKFIIQEQMALRTTNTQKDVTELKFKV